MSPFLKLLVLALTTTICSSYSTSSITMRKGRPSAKKAMSSLSKNANSPTTSATSIPSNWKLIPDIKTSQLPDKDGEITLIDTNLDGIKDGAVNPTGAICCASFSGKLYAFKVNCSCCQVPMNKAKILPPPETGLLEAPRLSCDFCGSTFNLRTGEPVDDATKSEGAGGNMLGGMVKGLMKSRGRKPVTVYALSSDAKDRVLISL